MKKFCVVIAIVLACLTGSVYAEETKTLTAGVEFNWVNMLQFQRDEAIEHYKQAIFSNEYVKSIKKKEFRKTYEDFLKKKKKKTHYRLISNGATETKEASLCGFFINDDILYSYAIQYKDNPRFVYYYTAFGKLAYVDISSEKYPEYPYYSRQYRANGKLSGAIYFVSKDLQYVYEPDGKFKGVWYKEKMFDRNAKQILTRNNW